MIKLNTLLLTAALPFMGFSQNEFTFDFYSQLDTESNVLFSPTSIKTCFAMAFEGANNQTQKEFEKVFGFEEDNSTFLDQTDHLKDVASISNSTWILEGYNILPSFIKKMKSSFDAKPNYTDFAGDPVGSADKINKWIDESTNGMIKKMLEPADVTAFKMALVNAIYFKQDWKYPFEKDATEKEKFKNLSGEKSEIDMMHAKRYYRAFEGQNEKVIELPYADDKTSMVIILPRNMKKYELTDAVYSDLTSNLRNQLVNLEMPKFTFETPTFNLIPTLTSLGLKAAFTTSADFSGMRAENDLMIGKALHKAKIIVNEEGTEAAAVTVIGAVTTSTAIPPPPKIMEMNIDQPFFYFIKDNQTGTILFMGRMNSLK